MSFGVRRCDRPVGRPFLRSRGNGKETHTPAGQERRAPGGLLHRLQNLNRLAKDVGDDLPPEHTAGAAAGQNDGLGFAPSSRRMSYAS